jgi:hypothetical protein
MKSADGNRGNNAAAHEAADDHEAATEPTGGYCLIGKKLNERKPEQAQKRKRRPSPREDTEPDSGRAGIGCQLATQGRSKPKRMGTAELRHEDLDSAEMHDEDDEASQYDRSKKPRGDQVVPIAGPRGRLGKV